MNILTYITVSSFLLLTPKNLVNAYNNWLSKNQEHQELDSTNLNWYHKPKLLPPLQPFKAQKKTRWNRQNSDEDEWFIFDEVEPKSSTTQRNSLVPGMQTTQSPCEDACRTTMEYNPACGDDNITYTNPRRLICAQKCGKRVFLKHLGRCSMENPFG